MEFQDELAGGTVLIRPALQSPDYTPGSAGWIIRIDGTAEFSDLVIRSSDGISQTIEIANGEITFGATDSTATLSGDYLEFRDANTVLPKARMDKNGLVATDSLFPYQLATTYRADGISSETPLGEIEVGPTLTPTIAAGTSVGWTATTGRLGPTDDAGILTMSATADTTTLSYSSATALADFALNGIDQGRGIQDFTATTASTALAAGEAIGVTSGVVDFEIGRAYRVTLHYQGSGSTAGDELGFRMRRTNLAGTSLFDSLRTHQLNAGGAIVNGETSQLIHNNTGAVLSTVIVGTVYRASGAGTVQMFANAANPVWIQVEDVGAIAAFPGIKAM